MAERLIVRNGCVLNDDTLTTGAAVVQIASAKTEGLPFVGDAKTQMASDALVTQVIQLKYAEPADVVAALQPYANTYAQPMALPKSRSAERSWRNPSQATASQASSSWICLRHSSPAAGET